MFDLRQHKFNLVSLSLVPSHPSLQYDLELYLISELGLMRVVKASSV